MPCLVYLLASSPGPFHKLRGKKRQASTPPSPSSQAASPAPQKASQPTRLNSPKTSLQLRSNIKGSGHGTSNNPLGVIAQIISRRGPLALYTGCSSLVLGNMGRDGVRFFAYEAASGRPDNSVSSGSWALLSFWAIGATWALSTRAGLLLGLGLGLPLWWVRFICLRL